MGKRARKKAVKRPQYPHLTVNHADELERALRHLRAALFVVSGGGCDMFEEMHPDWRDDYLCMCSDLAIATHARAAQMLSREEAANG